MPRIIRGQTITGTGLDRHGDRLTPEEVRSLFDRWPDSLLSGVNHDVGQRPVCRTFNKRLESLPDGELALKVDVEVLDEERFREFGGFSISFSRRRVRLGLGHAGAELSVNPRQFDFDSVLEAVSHRVQESGTVDVIERVEKADLLETALVSIGVFVGLQTFAGFFNAAGASLFELMRRAKRSDQPAGPVQVQFHLHLAPDQRAPVIVLSVSPEATTADIRQINGPAILVQVNERFGRLPVQKVVGHVSPGGSVEIDHVTGMDGRLLFSAGEPA